MSEPPSIPFRFPFSFAAKDVYLPLMSNTMFEVHMVRVWIFVSSTLAYCMITTPNKFCTHVHLRLKGVRVRVRSQVRVSFHPQTHQAPVPEWKKSSARR